MAGSISSAALRFIRGAMGLSGPGAQTSFLEDGSVLQTLEVKEFAARALSPGKGGLFYSEQGINSASAGEHFEELDPYSPTEWTNEANIVTVGGNVRSEYDLWLLGWQARVRSGGAALVSVSVVLEFPKAMRGPGGLNLTGSGWDWIVQYGDTLTNSGNFTDLTFTQALFTLSAGQINNINSANQVCPMYFPRGMKLGLHTDNGSGGSQLVTLCALWAVVPAGSRPSVIGT